METAKIGTHLILSAGHEFSAEEINYIEQNQTTVAAVREAIGKMTPIGIGDGVSLEALIGEAVSQAKAPAGSVEPNVVDPTDPRNEGVELGETSATTADL